MAGYRRPPLLLVFDGEQYEGLEVRCRRPTIGDILDLARLRTVTADATEAAVMAKVDGLMARMASLITAWNLVGEDDEPVPVTAETVAGQDYEFVLAIAGAIGAGGAGVAPPLPQPSEGGVPSLEASIPMETLSPSLPN
jgi:hypothetical protein